VYGGLPGPDWPTSARPPRRTASARTPPAMR